MIYPARFEEKISFDKIRALISDECISAMGRQFVEKIRFSTNKDVVINMLEQVEEFEKLIQTGKPFPVDGFIDMREVLKDVKIPGTYIDIDALFDLKLSLKTIKTVFDYLSDLDQEEFPRLHNLLEELYFPEDILFSCERIIDDKGQIKDAASEKLADIRKQIISKQRQVLRATRKAFETAQKAGWVPDNAEITVRNGRSVIPLKASDKRALKGFIHDESATGQTVFLEPGESFEINNEIRELENEERREIIKILTRFTDELRPSLSILFQLYRFLGLTDFIRAKTLFSINIKAVKPAFTNNKLMTWHKAIHPLLYLSHNSQGKEVVPLDISLDTENRILVISGPNAGGKSVCLKTVGLLQYMLQCGLPVPLTPESQMHIFDKLFIDIGDEQSLENDLSTYSSHLLNMKFFLRNADKNTLFLIDEFGTGTEPMLGGAIAEAVLEELNKKEAFGVVTTHYTNLKIAAEKNPGMINGAMLFDSKEMKPLFKLKIGKPGSSFTFEIARKIGFPKYVLEKAKRKIGHKAVNFDQQLQQLELEKLKLEKREKKLESLEHSLAMAEKDFTELRKQIENKKKEIIEKARKEALQIIEDSNKAVERTIREIKESKADKMITKAARKKLEQKKGQIKEQTQNKPPTKNSKSSKENIEAQDFNPGDWVKIKDSEMVGELLSVKGEDVEVNINNVKLKTSLDKLEHTNAKPDIPKKARAQRRLMNDINKKAANFNLSIDLRGKRADEALSILKKYIDDAVLLNVNEVDILHGKGNEILRQIIREYLDTVEEIKHYSDAPLEMGGSGITRVYFR